MYLCCSVSGPFFIRIHTRRIRHGFLLRNQVGYGYFVRMYVIRKLFSSSHFSQKTFRFIILYLTKKRQDSHKVPSEWLHNGSPIFLMGRMDIYPTGLQLSVSRLSFLCFASNPNPSLTEKHNFSFFSRSLFFPRSTASRPIQALS